MLRSPEPITGPCCFSGPECDSFLLASGMADPSLRYMRSRTYAGIRCNWKVYCDNYLDGGYHVPIAHRELAAGLDVGGYRHKIFENASVQLCDAAASAEAAVASALVSCRLLVEPIVTPLI
jgi:Ring hydroxylating alpha subunit (catalytic domain)